jgi:hypothetical protein
VIDQVLAPLLTGADLIPEAMVEVAVRLGTGLLLQPDQLLPQFVAAEVGEGGGDHWFEVVNCVNCSTERGTVADAPVGINPGKDGRDSGCPTVQTCRPGHSIPQMPTLQRRWHSPAGSGGRIPDHGHSGRGSGGLRFSLVQVVNCVNCITDQAGSAPIRVFSNDDPIAADLSVSELFRQIQAEHPGAVGVGGSVLPGSGGADHVVAGHWVSFELQSSYSIQRPTVTRSVTFIHN